MKPIVIAPVTPAQVAAMVNELRANNSTVTDAGGVPLTYTVEGHGVTAKAVFVSNTLTVLVLHKPFYVTLGEIENGLHIALGTHSVPL
jgi:hypothetical protein